MSEAKVVRLVRPRPPKFVNREIRKKYGLPLLIKGQKHSVHQHNVRIDKKYTHCWKIVKYKKGSQGVTEILEEFHIFSSLEKACAALRNFYDNGEIKKR